MAGQYHVHFAPSGRRKTATTTTVIKVLGISADVAQDKTYSGYQEPSEKGDKPVRHHKVCFMCSVFFVCALDCTSHLYPPI